MTRSRSLVHRSLTLALALSLAAMAPAALAGTRQPAAAGGNSMSGAAKLPTTYAALAARASGLTALGRATLRGMR